nr:carbon-nitrogen family hydrolase [Gordonia sp. LAM0048]
MKIALVQVASPDDETAAHRLDRVRTLVDGLPDDIDLIVLPELWRVGYNHFDDYPASAEDLYGPTVSTMAAIARRRSCLVHAGSIVEDRGSNRLRNTAVLLGPDGTVVHHYSKVHVFGYQSQEARLLEPGEQVHAVDTAFGPVAATTCYDLRFPGLWSEIGLAGAQLVIVPAAWPMARREHWRLLTSARAVDNQVFVIACNAAGTHAGVELAGHSRIVDPWGSVVAEAGSDEGVTLAEIDPALVSAVRSEFPVLGDRLPDYSVLSRRKVHS